MRDYHVYIMASRSRVLYVGVTSMLSRRVAQHKAAATGGFTAKYSVNRLVYLERTGNITDAIRREKQLKRWRRSKKVKLIEGLNPEWADLASAAVSS